MSYRRVSLLLAAVSVASSMAFGCAADARSGASGGSASASAASTSRTLPPPKSRDEILDLVAPCAITGEGVRCWGRFAGGIELAPVDGKLRDATELLGTGGALCGRKNPAGPWSCTGTGLQPHYQELQAGWPAFLEKLGPDLVDARYTRGDAGTMLALLSDGTVIQSDGKNERRESAGPGIAIRPVQCAGKGDKANGWAVLGVDGRVGTSPDCEGVDLAAWTDIAQIDGHRGTLCARTRDGRVLLHNPNAKAWEAVHAAGGFAGVKDAVDIACSPWAACVLFASGRISCAGEVGLEKERSEGPATLLDIGVENARALWLSTTEKELCVASGSDVLCSSVGDEGLLNDVVIPVDGVPDMVDVATSDYLVCGRTEKDAVWCWGDNRAPFELTGVKARAITLAGGILYWIDDRGDLRRRPLAVSKQWKAEATASPEVVVAIAGAWPEPPTSLELIASYSTSMQFMCARHASKARCFVMKRNGTGAQSFEVPFPVKAFAPGPTFAFEREDGKISLMSELGKKTVDDFRPGGAPKDAVPRLVAGQYDGNFTLQFDSGDEVSCVTGTDGVLCQPPRRQQPVDWQHSLLRMKDGVLFDGTKRIAEGVREIDSASATVFLTSVPGKPHVFSFNATPMGVAGELGRRGHLTRLRQRR